MLSLRVLCLDPGDHTGWLLAEYTDYDKSSVPTLRCGTTYLDHVAEAELILMLSPDIVVYENFHLYPGMSKSLSWNSFYPCEVIGIVKYLCESLGIEIYQQSPSIKKYAGGLQQDWVELRKHSIEKTTEHSKDAYLHWKYFERNSLQKAIEKLRNKRENQ